MMVSDEQHEEKVRRVLEHTANRSTLNSSNLSIVLRVLLRKLTDEELDELWWSIP